MEKESQQQQQQQQQRDSVSVKVSLFDSSVENHFQAINQISKLCDEQHTNVDLENADVQRLSSSITFLREWRHFNYDDKSVGFATQTENFSWNQVRPVILPQFSSAAVPQDEGLSETTTPPEFSKDFVMYVGGSVWAMDWCPRAHNPACRATSEFIAVAAHPPNAYYHQLGVPLTGRGIIQIWSILNVKVDQNKNPKHRHQKNEPTKGNSTEPKKPLGRPRKNALAPPKPTKPKGRPRKTVVSVSPPRNRPKRRSTQKLIDKSTDDMESNSMVVPALAVEYPESSSELLAIEGVNENEEEEWQSHGNKEKSGTKKGSTKKSVSTKSTKAKSERANVDLQSSTQNQDEGSPVENQQVGGDSEKDATTNNPLSENLSSCVNPKNLALPRVILCLAHNGKVAWDVKWRPSSDDDPKCNHRMGFLAVLLGNGLLEVWEIPLPHTLEAMYSQKAKDGTDPRFVKLEPVFRTSILKCGDRQSIPLTMEWSTSYPHDYLLAGCHDGTVALWKFSATVSPKGSNKVYIRSLCFYDTYPIRAVAWAPVDSDRQGGNIILTAGHEGLKVWDIRDPFRPLWDLHPVPRFIYSVDWMPDPRCIIMSFDDGTMRLLGLSTSAYDFPVTGKPFTGTKQQGLHVYNYTSFAVWSVQVSRSTGVAAYCSADGTVLHFQLTTKAVEKDFSRNKAQHYICGAFSEEDSTVIVKTPLPNNPVALKKPVNLFGDSCRSLKSLVTDAGKTPCHDPDVEFESESESELTLAVIMANKKSKSKSKSSSKSKAQDDQASEKTPSSDRKMEEINKETEKYPSKNVALHKVRWNVNKGSEKWLCYGGAAGIIRCQEIVTTDVDWKRSGSKRKDL
ncbi:hypothetical protein ACFE04_019903 [Oxalis oulophora]